MSLADEKDDGGGVAKSQPWPVESEVLPHSEEISDTSKLVSCGLIYFSDGIQMIDGFDSTVLDTSYHFGHTCEMILNFTMKS